VSRITSKLKTLEAILDDLVEELRLLRFGAPISHVYNPLEYARESYTQYLKKYATSPKQIVFVGMNPGPWGMAQTGVPFGEINAVRDWLEIRAPVGTPPDVHPKRPVLGFDCTKREVSGKRLWGWAQVTFQTPGRFFSRFFVGNYCPLLFIETSGRNRTPDQIRTAERQPMLNACDRALRRTIEQLNPRYVVGVGQFAGKRARAALTDYNITIGTITHPSPANPKANHGWAALITKELKDLGIQI
jgi:single-strand selective monofunctional uracil DNA glycosylase